MDIAIIGGGAAGCFAAINIKRGLPDANVTVYESGNRVLAKVAITGGGRCNLTNSFDNVRSLESVYPRGFRLMKRLFNEFDHVDACSWFNAEGVELVTQNDQCVFPRSQDAMEIVGALVRGMNMAEVKVRTGCKVVRIKKEENGYNLVTEQETIHHDIVLVTTGGSPKSSGLEIFKDIDIDLIPPVPSLFSLCLEDRSLKSLMGTVVEDAAVALSGTKFRAVGPLLITDWGVSGPAILKLSSYAARFLSECGYKGNLAINWFGEMNEEEVVGMISSLASGNPQKYISNVYPERFNSRLWSHLLVRSGLRPDMRWGELAKKSFNRLISLTTNDIYEITGKNRFKDEFVTCGGVALGNVNPSTLECRKYPGLYFAGEILDVDAITGGFNLQAAWTMGMVAARAISAALSSSLPPAH